MFDFIINIVLYTFAVFGIIIFFSSVLNYIKYPKINGKIILVFDDVEDFEVILREISYLVNTKGIANNIYILLDNISDTDFNVLKKIANTNNISIIDSQEQLLKCVRGV